MRSVEKIEFQCQGPVQRPKHPTVDKRARTPGGQMVEEGVPTVILMIFLIFTLSLGPLEDEIHVFSDGLSENDRKSINERVHKFYSSGLIFAGTVIFFIHGKGARGIF